MASLAKVKVDLHAKDEGRRPNNSAGRVVVDRWTDATSDQVHTKNLITSRRFLSIA